MPSSLLRLKLRSITEPLIPLRRIPSLPCCPRTSRNRPLHYSAVLRWATRGVRGIQLPVVRVGARLCTTERALLDFLSRATNTEADAAPALTSAALARSAAAAELDAEGM